MIKENVEKIQGGFSVKPTIEYKEKQAREKHMKERKENPSKSTINTEIMSFLQDISDRQSEIYDLLKEK